MVPSNYRSFDSILEIPSRALELSWLSLFNSLDRAPKIALWREHFLEI